MTARTRTDILLLAGFCTFLFFYGIAQFGLIGADEPRYAQVSREMLEAVESASGDGRRRAFLRRSMQLSSSLPSTCSFVNFVPRWRSTRL